MQGPTSRMSREMAMKKGPSRIEYMCSYCGMRIVMRAEHGRPEGKVCPKRSTGSRDYPHLWRVNRKLD